MKALKTVAVALGITLAALIVIPLIVLAGLFVWLKVTEEAGGGDPRARSRRRLDRQSPSRRAGDAAADRTSTPAGDRRAFRCPRVAHVAADRRLAEIGVLGVMVLWAGELHRRQVGRSAVLPPVGFTFLRFIARVGDAVRSCSAGARAAIGLPRRDLLAICGLGAPRVRASTRSSGRPA